MAGASTVVPVRLRCIALLAVFALGTVAATGVAQGPAPVGLRRLAVPPAERAAALFLPQQGQNTRWKEGMFIGAGAGVGVGLLGVALNSSLCEGTQCHITAYYFIGPILILSIIGGLIGSGIHKT